MATTHYGSYTSNRNTPATGKVSKRGRIAGGAKKVQRLGATGKILKK